jgi:hypothetical protein
VKYEKSICIVMFDEVSGVVIHFNCEKRDKTCVRTFYWSIL